MPRTVHVVSAASILALAACGGGTGPYGGVPQPPPPANEVNATPSLTLKPGQIIINSGESVTFAFGSVAQSFTFPAGTVIESGGYIVVNEVMIPGGLSATDIVGMYNKFGVVADAAGWGGNVPGTAYARCPDGRGAFVSTLTPTWEAANACP